MSDLVRRQDAINALEKVAELYPWRVPGDRDSYSQYNEAWQDALNRADSEIEALPSAQEIIRCHQCGYWDRDTLQHNFNDFRDWNEAECLVLAERDGYHEINRYTEADDFCSRAERRTDG